MRWGWDPVKYGHLDAFYEEGYFKVSVNSGNIIHYTKSLGIVLAYP